MEAECGTGSPLHHQELCDLHIKCAQEAAGLFHQVNNNNNNIDVVESGLCIHRSALVDTDTCNNVDWRYAVGPSRKSLVGKNILDVILASSWAGLYWLICLLQHYFNFSFNFFLAMIATSLSEVTHCYYFYLPFSR